MGKKGKVYLDLTLAMIFAGSSVVAGKFIAANLPVFLASGLRFAISSLILVPLLLIFEGGFVSLKKRDYLILALQAFTGVFLFSIFLLYGLRLTGAAQGGIITSTTPAVVGVISFLFLKERLSGNKCLGIMLAVLGIILASVMGSLVEGTGQGSLSLLGDLLIFGAVVGEALFTIFRKILPETVSPLATATLVSVFGFLMFLPFSVYEAVNFDFSTGSLRDWLVILYYGIGVSVIGFILWFQGVTKVPASTAAVFTGVMPVSAVLLSYIVLREAFSVYHVLGGLCVLLGIGFIARNDMKGPDAGEKNV